MAIWFECKVRYDKLQENGTSVKKVTETFLVDATSFTEAEARVIDERTAYISGDFTVSAVKRTKISEIVYSETGDKYYMVKWVTIAIDAAPENDGKAPVEKKVSILTLVQASSLKEALDAFEESMRGSLADFEITQIAETPILDVYPYKAKQIDD